LNVILHKEKKEKKNRTFKPFATEISGNEPYGIIMESLSMHQKMQ
jgi:hypothetical protein